MISLKVVYFHKLKEDSEIQDKLYHKGKILYIGSGSCARPQSKANRSRLHLELWDKLEAEIIEENLSLEDARKIEQEYINKHWDSFLLNVKRKIDKVKDYNYEFLNNLFYLDKDYNLRWKATRRNSIGTVTTKEGQLAGYFQKSGYGLVSVSRINYSIHRIIWCLCNKQSAPAGYVVDHIDRNPANNLPENLRLVSHRENQLNKSENSNTGHKNITFYNKSCHFLIQKSVTHGGVARRRLYGMKKMLKNGVDFETAFKVKLEEAIKIRDSLCPL